MLDDEKTPQSPAAAFEQFIRIVRNSSPIFDADPDTLLRLLRPFLANPSRDAAHAGEIASAYAAARFSQVFSRAPLFKQFLWFMKKRARGNTMQEVAPNFIHRLEALELTLGSELKPGSVSLNLMPVRYLDTPVGFGEKKFHRYRFLVQTLIESTDDELQSVAVEFVADDSMAVVDDILPRAGFSTVGLKRSAGMQLGQQRTKGEKASAAGEMSGAGAKVSTAIESSSSEQNSNLVTMSGEQSLARVEQYLFARKIGSRAMWRALSGVGPVDAAGAEYTVDLLVPADIRQVHIRVDVKIEWLHAGTVPAEVKQTVPLPAPESKNLVHVA